MSNSKGRPPGIKPNGELIKAFRAFKPWTQSQLSEYARCSARTIASAEDGESISGDTLERIAKLFGVEPQLLISRAVEEEREELFSFNSFSAELVRNSGKYQIVCTVDVGDDKEKMYGKLCDVANNMARSCPGTGAIARLPPDMSGELKPRYLSIAHIVFADGTLRWYICAIKPHLLFEFKREFDLNPPEIISSNLRNEYFGKILSQCKQKTICSSCADKAARLTLDTAEIISDVIQLDSNYYYQINRSMFCNIKDNIDPCL